MKSRHRQAEAWKLVAFLGNPGTRYETTRHNAGRMVLETLLTVIACPPWKEKFHGRFTRYGETVLLVPQTYMNESGRSVQAATAFFSVPPSELLVVHDDLETPFGTVALAFGGGHRGNNGIRSVAQALGTADFSRLRIGIGRPPAHRKPGDWVLERFTPEEESRLPEILQEAAGVIAENR